MRRSAPLKRGKPPRRSTTPIRRVKALRRGTKAPTRRKAISRRSRPSSYYLAERKARLEAADYRCEIRVRCFGALVGTTHHVKTKGRDKRFDRVDRAKRRLVDHRSNLRAVCNPCHQFVHQNPAIAEEHGWLRPSWEDDAA